MLNISDKTIVPQVLLRFTVFFYHWTLYSSQLFTLLFCALRVAILYSNPNEEKEKMIYYLLPPFIIFPILASTPHLVTEGLCQQMPQPSPFGAVLLISRFNLDHKVETAFVTLGFTAIVTFTIIGLNISMFWKICKRKKLPAAGQSKSIQNQKVSKTLTGTMIIMLIPLIIYLLSAASEFIPNDDFNFIMFFGAIAGDIRVHIVTCYFYFTHPVFKKQGMTRKVDVTQRVTVN